MSSPEVKLAPISYLILELTRLIDSGKFHDISIEEVYSWMREEEILSSLQERTSGEIDLSPYGANGAYPGFDVLYHDRMFSYYNAYSSGHFRKWGIENLGLCLLLAWTIELIKTGSD